MKNFSLPATPLVEDRDK